MSWSVKQMQSILPSPPTGKRGMANNHHTSDNLNLQRNELAIPPQL